jgi:hypothetical protein
MLLLPKLRVMRQFDNTFVRGFVIKHKIGIMGLAGSCCCERVTFECSKNESIWT